MSLEVGEQVAAFRGYQEFLLNRLTRQPLPVEAVLTRKRDLLAPYFTARYLAGRTVLDLGAAGGFYSYWALAGGAERAVAVDIDDGCLGLIAQAKALFDLDRLTAVRANVAEWEEPADVVLALALVHWIYSCTTVLGSLDAVVAKLAGLTKYLLLVEWVEPNDPAIEFFQHTSWNRELVRGLYTLEAFEAALRTYFARHETVGEVSPTRRLYAAFTSDHEIDLSGPLPLLLPKETLIVSQCLTVVDGIPYWSRVYDAGDIIWKQATLDLAAREAHFLRKLRGVHFPRVLDVRTEPDFSVLTLEKIEGQPVTKAAGALTADRKAFITFVCGCLDILGELKAAGIVHRDIRPENVIARGMTPVLFDFGWAVADDLPYCTPRLLGGTERPPDGSFSDTYSMGKVIERVKGDRFPEFNAVLALMTDRDPLLRIESPDILRTLVRASNARLPRTGAVA